MFKAIKINICFKISLNNFCFYSQEKFFICKIDFGVKNNKMKDICKMKTIINISQILKSIQTLK